MLDVPSENLLRAIFHTLAYSDVFDYPLTASEIYRYLTATGVSAAEVVRALANENLFARVGEYYTLHGRAQIIETRKRRGVVASRLWPKAARYGRIIASLPFVRMVAVTGSLAMNNTDEGQDVDYMIVTEPQHLWTCRALSLFIARFAKLEGISLCPNYLVTLNALELNERSLYVAHELAQMIPLSGMEFYSELRRRNAWTDEYLPNAGLAPELPQGVKQAQEYSVMRRVLEALSRLPFANWFETWEMHRKIARLSREQSASFESYFSSEVCKGHVDRHGETVVTALANRLANVSVPDPTDESISVKEMPARSEQAR